MIRELSELEHSRHKINFIVAALQGRNIVLEQEVHRLQKSVDGNKKSRVTVSPAEFEEFKVMHIAFIKAQHEELIRIEESCRIKFEAELKNSQDIMIVLFFYFCCCFIAIIMFVPIGG